MVSVIIPVYNVEKYLRECIDSILGQTYQALEIILVDDGSTDTSGAICEEYRQKDERIKVIHKNNGGLFDARNAGLTAVHGEYVYFQDSDDWIKTETIAHLVNFIEQENADLILFDAETVFEDFEDENYYEDLKRKKNYATESGASVFMQLINENEFLACACLHLFRTDFLKQIKFRFPKVMIHEDEVIMPITYVKAKRVAHLHEALYIRRLRAGSIMSQKDTVLSVECLSKGIIAYIKELNNYPSGSIERKAMLLCIDRHISTIMHKYALLDKASRKKALPSLKKAARAAAQLPVGECPIARLKISHPRMFCLCRALFLPIKKRFWD